jgi:hypothetical protein
MTPDGFKLFTISADATYGGVSIWTHYFASGNRIIWTLVFDPNWGLGLPEDDCW